MAGQPTPIAKFAAGVIVSALAGAVVAKLWGKNAGLAGAVVVYAAHERLDAPLARYLSAQGL